MHEHREIDVKLRVTHDVVERRTGVYRREHRRGHEVSVTGGTRRGEVEVERVALSDGERILADLLAYDDVVLRRPVPALLVGLDRHWAERSL
jgi:hypothetical protein